MSGSLQVRILNQDTPVCESSLAAPLELGRQRAGEPDPYRLLPAAAGSPARLIIAPQHDKDNISRKHLTLAPLPDGRVRVSNHSQADLDTDEASVAPGASVELAPPFSLALPNRTVLVEPADSGDEHGIHSLAHRTLAPGAADLSLDSGSLLCLRPDQLLRLLEHVPRALGVLQCAIGSDDFLDRASSALVDIVGLDSGRVLLRRGDAWVQHAAVPGWQPSRHVLDRLLATRSAVWQLPQRRAKPDSASLTLLDAVVAAPLLDRHENVIGALYGERRKDSPRPGRADSQVEVLLVNLLACGVSTGLARLAQEQAAFEATALFGQFFTPELVRHLAKDPTLLSGREADVTVLFADVRGFSRHSERLGAATAIKWMNDVLDELSRCVRDEGGVLVDYVGDELMAMWGAPEPQPDQASRAVRAAFAMQAALPGLTARWRSHLDGEALMVGIGINSGTAQVGNVGSRIKFKYGALGNTVNLASRVQGLTKYLRSGLLITAATRNQLDAAFIARRVVKVRVVNIEKPVEVYEVERAGLEPRRTFFDKSEKALLALEAHEFAEAAWGVGDLLRTHPGDGPLRLILARAADALVREGFDPVWTPPGK